MARRRLTLKEWALIASLFVSAATGVSIIWRGVQSGLQGIDRRTVSVVQSSREFNHHIVQVVRDSLDCCKEGR